MQSHLYSVFMSYPHCDEKSHLEILFLLKPYDKSYSCLRNWSSDLCTVNRQYVCNYVADVKMF